MQKKQIISSIIVPNLKKDLLDSFLSNNLQFFDFKKEELIIVSSSLDSQNTADYQKKYPKVRFVVIKKNKGFTSTVNLGFEKAKAHKWLVTINDDVILSKGWLEKMTIDLPDNIGSINPIIVDKNGDIESAGIKILPKGKAEPINSIPKKVLTKVDATNGACVVYSKKALQKVGFFDEKFGSYLEDIDLSLRLKRNGFINMVNKSVKITHLKHSTAKNMANYKNYLDFKNWILVICKNWGFGEIMRHLPAILLERVRNLSGVLKADKKLLLRIVVFILFIGIFIFSRLYKIQTSLLFFNDIGRDFLTLLDWQRSGKPPLLGPQTSALPYNQSAVYFYLLYPLFVLTNHSPFSTIFALLTFYIFIFSFIFIYLYKTPVLQKSLLISLFLIIIHPQFISQNRFVWNPSFLAPLILLSFYAFIKLKTKFNYLNLLLFAFTITLAVSLSYSVAPLFIGYIILTLFLFYKKNNFIKIYIASFLGLIFWNLPTIFFELRHHFLLTNLLIRGEKLQQLAISFDQKISDILKFTLPRLNELNAIIFIIALLFFVFVNLKFLSKKSIYLNISIYLLILTVIITFVVPISIQAHYIFAILTLLFLIIGLLDIKFSIIFILFLSYLWINKATLWGFFGPASRSVKATQQCAIDFCSQHAKPLFVSAQAGNHPYHNAMEFRYMFKNYGCDVKNLDTEIGQAQEMAVVLDNSEYVHGETKYNELTQFGDSQELSRFFCTDKLKVVILKKNGK